jgi:deoxyribodipyrimidine photo-lyase
MVDACMRSLCATGWLNFRMRAMLVSFAAHHLGLHWREPGLFLARQFLDFEPGIHWSQMQMQSGTTGINTLRIYSPTKQALDQDPEGIFIRHWCSELAHVPLALLAQPWKMTLLEQQNANCIIGQDYPAPIVEEKSAMQFAKDQLYGLRKTADAKEESKVIANKHGSRKGGLPQVRRTTKTKPVLTPPASSLQGDLF